LAALWVLKSAASLRQVMVLCDCCLLTYSIMTTTNSPLSKKNEKLEWVTPKISLMDAGETFGKQTFAVKEYVPIGPQTGGVGPS
jgi:hypothetical protein